jgi:hypothetical protein
MDWSYKECTVTIRTAKTGSRFRAIVKVVRPGGGENLMMMSDSFPTIEMAEDYGKSMARDWIDKNVK